MSDATVKIAIPGAGGRMGGMLIREIAAAEDLQLVATTDRPDSLAIGEDAGLVAGLRENGVIIGDDPAALFDQADVVLTEGLASGDRIVTTSLSYPIYGAPLDILND